MYMERVNGLRWTEVEIRRFIRRAGRLEKEGLANEPAEQLAEELLYRDRGDHDLRLCFECQHLIGKRCAQSNQQAMRFMLQRCPQFVLRGVEKKER